ncbi:MAG: hypothetical protein ABIG71_02220 [Candidatus Uhrbacteria bacterium]
MDRTKDAPLLEWEFSAYEQHERGRRWYMLAFAIALALLIYAIATKNFLFVVLIIMLSTVLYLRHARTPERIRAMLTERGVILDEQELAYEQISSFWIVEPPNGRPTLYLDPKGLRSNLVIPIEVVSPDVIHSVLASRVTEDSSGEESGAEVISKTLRL